MTGYHLDRVATGLLSFLDDLTNWYIRFNRPRLKGEDGDAECYAALQAPRRQPAGSGLVLLKRRRLRSALTFSNLVSEIVERLAKKRLATELGHSVILSVEIFKRLG